MRGDAEWKGDRVSDHERPTPLEVFGRTGLRVSALCLGAMTFGEARDWGAYESAGRAVFEGAGTSSTPPLIGARHVEQLDDNLGCLDVEFTAGQLQRLDEAGRVLAAERRYGG